MVIVKAKFEGSKEAFAALLESYPNLTAEADDGGAWLSGAPVALRLPLEGLREQLEAFARRANTVIALSHPSLSAISPAWQLRIVDGQRTKHVVLPGPAQFEITGQRITLSAGSAPRNRRSMAERTEELSARKPRFQRAANILAEAGEDLVKLYFVMELIEHAHGGFPPKKKTIERSAFCETIQIDEAEWEALHRSARPYRHAEPHEDEGPIVSPRLARHLLQHALKLWLEREVPV